VKERPFFIQNILHLLNHALDSQMISLEAADFYFFFLFRAYMGTYTSSMVGDRSFIPLSNHMASMPRG
jgi:hypothetical protein